MNKEDKELLIKEIENCYYNHFNIYDIPLLLDTKYQKSLYNQLIDKLTATKILINNKYGLLANLLYKYKDNVDEDILIKMIIYDIDNFNSKMVCNELTDKLFKNKEFTKTVVPKQWYLLQYVNKELKNDKDIALAAVRQNINSI